MGCAYESRIEENMSKQKVSLTEYLQENPCEKCNGKKMISDTLNGFFGGNQQSKELVCVMCGKTEEVMFYGTVDNVTVRPVQKYEIITKNDSRYDSVKGQAIGGYRGSRKIVPVRD